MELEKEISQSKFKNGYHKAAVNIIFTYNWLIGLNNKIFDKEDITISQYNILRILRGQNGKPASVILLKSRMLDKMCDASRIVERLVIKELVERKMCVKDRRSVDILITEKGLNLLERIDRKDNTKSLLSKNLTIEEVTELNRLLDKMRD